MKAFFLCALLLLVGAALAARPHRAGPKPVVPAVTQQLVDEINNMGTTWTAALNEKSTVHGMTFEEARSLCGVLPGPTFSFNYLRVYYFHFYFLTLVIRRPQAP